MKKYIITLLTLGLMSTYTQAQDMSLDQLLKVVQRAATESSQANQQREADFKRQRDQQSRLLSEARAQLAALERRTEELKTAFDENELTLADLETTLAERAGNLGEMAGTVKVLAGDLRSALEESMTSAEIDGRVRLHIVVRLPAPCIGDSSGPQHRSLRSIEIAISHVWSLLNAKQVTGRRLSVPDFRRRFGDVFVARDLGRR